MSIMVEHIMDSNKWSKKTSKQTKRIYQLALCSIFKVFLTKYCRLKITKVKGFDRNRMLLYNNTPKNKLEAELNMVVEHI